MKVFVVWGSTPDSNDIIGIFSTIELASEIVAEYATINYRLIIEEYTVINNLKGIR